MKTPVRKWWPSAGFFGLSLLLAFGDSPASPRVTLTIKEGSRLVGQIEVDTLMFQYPMSANLDIPLARIRTITWPAGRTNALVTFFNGDKIAANPVGKDLRLKTCFGEVIVPWAIVTQMLVDKPAVAGGYALAHWWSGDADAKDNVGEAHGKLVNGAAVTPGKIGAAFTFDGKDDYVEFPADAGNFGTNDFTIGFWMRSDAESCALLGKRPACNCDQLVFWDMRAGRGIVGFEARSGNGEWVQLRGEANVGDGRFHHVAVTREGKDFAIYIDGIVKHRATVGVTELRNNTPLQAGTNPCIGVDGTVPYRGQLDEIRFYNRALTTAEIEALFAGKDSVSPEKK
jgi:hypothetical protein